MNEYQCRQYYDENNYCHSFQFNILSYDCNFVGLRRHFRKQGRRLSKPEALFERSEFARRHVSRRLFS